MVDITGKKDAMAIKERYQEALDQFHESIKSKIDWLYGMNHKLKDNLAAVQKHKKNIIADEEEKIKLYSSLNNLLSKETDFEKTMMKTSRKGSSSRVTIKTKFKDVDDVRFNAMQDYLDKYPEYASKSSFKKILEKITETEKGIKETKKKYNHTVSEVLRELAYWPRNLMEAEDKIKRFRKTLKKGKEELKNMRYLKSVAYKLSSHREKNKVNLDVLYYKVDSFEKTIKKLKEEVEKAKKKDLEEMDY